MKMRTLLADKNAGVQEMPVRVLKSEQYEVVLTRKGRKTALRIAANPPDLDEWARIKLMAAKHSIERFMDSKDTIKGRTHGDRE
jgi:hypothetical protein